MSRLGAKRKRAPALTAKRLRQAAPSQDRNLPPLKPSPGPAHIPIGYRATTLDDLRSSCGRYADAAVADAEGYALSVWSMNLGITNPSPNFPGDVQGTALLLGREAASHEHGWPNLSGKPRQYRFANMSPESVAFAREVYADMLSHWRAAGSPHLASACQSARLYLKSCLLNRTENAA